MQVDFYQLSRDPVERVVPLLADKALASVGRVLVVASDPAQRTTLSEALWRYEAGFLAHGEAAAPHAEHQPIVIGDAISELNGARIAILADGEWRPEASSLDRAILLFAPEQTGEARTLWTELSADGHAMRIFKQRDGGGWKEGR